MKPTVIRLTEIDRERIEWLKAHGYGFKNSEVVRLAIEHLYRYAEQRETKPRF
jgi:hypothetical protein